MPRTALCTLAGVVVPLLMACAPRTHVAVPCTAPVVAMTDWQEAGGSVFTVRLPPTFHRDRVQGIDSEVGEWSDEGVRIGYDYGGYSDKLESPPQGARELSRCEVTLGGRPVRIVRFRSAKGEHVVAAHWPAVHSPDEPRERWSSTLTFWGEARQPRDAELLLAIIHSVRFKQAAPDASVPARPPSAAQLGWMAGCWERRRGSRLVEEQWMTPRGGLMLGASRTVRGDTLVEYEQTRIHERDGRLVFAATPYKQPPAEFESIEASDSSVTFSNATHDFPQRISYRRRGADSMLARVEGMEKGQLRGIDFPYERTSCH
jgi:hypothetical protein